MKRNKEFRKNDILVKIDTDRKYIVSGTTYSLYWLRREGESLSSGFSRETVEQQFVKVGRHKG